ncbi:MAG TPA: MFS transporter, partial [Candidatus Dormibacteraeota bacterium]|nr:MFS transporter [Candidatus Dormibacteraeota bacterium]
MWTSRSRWLLAVLLGGQTMASLDGAIVNVALPSIARDLHASGGALQVTVVGYLLTYAVLLVAGARLGDTVGHRSLFMAGLAAFTAASLVCGASVSIWMLVSARVVQGAAAACMVPQVLSLIQRCFEGAERARALSLYSAVLSLGVAAGQVLGGALTSANVAGTTWRAVFLVNVPVGAGLLLVAGRRLPVGRAEARGFDVPGMLALAVSMLLLVLPLAVGREVGWPAWSVASLALSAPALVTFVVVERAAAARARAVLVDLTLLADRVIACGLTAVVAVMAAFAAFAFMFTLHMQSGLGYAPLRASLTFLPYAVGFGCCSLVWRRLPVGWHRWIAPAGFAGLAAALLALAGSLTAGLRVPIVLPLMFTAGAGHAAAFAPLAVALASRVRPDQASSLSGMLSTGTTLAAVVGVATAGSVFLSVAAVNGTTRAFQVVAIGLAATMLAAGAVALAATGSRP